MASTIRRPRLAVWQLRLRDRRRRAQLVTVVLILLVVAAAEVRLARYRLASPTATSGPAPVARIAAEGDAEAGSEHDGAAATPSVDTLGPDERAVAISPPLAVPALGPGDLVEIVAVGLDPTGQARAEILGRPVRVIEVGDDAIVLALPETMVTPLLAAQAAGPIEAVRLP